MLKSTKSFKVMFRKSHPLWLCKKPLFIEGPPFHLGLIYYFMTQEMKRFFSLLCVWEQLFHRYSNNFAFFPILSNPATFLYCSIYNGISHKLSIHKRSLECGVVVKKESSIVVQEKGLLCSLLFCLYFRRPIFERNPSSCHGYATKCSLSFSHISCCVLMPVCP